MQDKPRALVRQAFEHSSGLLGERTKHALIEDLTSQGIYLNDPDLTITKLFHGIRQVIGDEAAQILAEQLILKLDELHSK